MHMLGNLGIFTAQNNRFCYPFIYLKPTKGTPLRRSLPVYAVVRSTPPPLPSFPPPEAYVINFFDKIKSLVYNVVISLSIHLVNLCPLDNAIGFLNAYSLESDIHWIVLSNV